MNQNTLALSAQDDDEAMTSTEKAAWILAYQLAEEDPRTVFVVWRSGGAYHILKANDKPPARAREMGRLSYPFSGKQSYQVYEMEGPTRTLFL